MKPVLQSTVSFASHPRQLESHAGIFTRSPIALLGALLQLFVSAPLIDDLPNGDLIEAALTTLVMIFAVLAVGARPRALLLALLLVTPALGGKWASHFINSPVTSTLYLVPATIFFAFVVLQLVVFVLHAPRVDANVLSAGLAGYLLLGLLWIPAYVLIARLRPSSFHLPDGAAMDGFNAFYFSFITLCTVGYGDFTPASKAARTLAICEAIAGVFYVAVLISRLVAVYSTSPDSAKETSPPS